MPVGQKEAMRGVFGFLNDCLWMVATGVFILAMAAESAGETWSDKEVPMAKQAVVGDASTVQGTPDPKHTNRLSQATSPYLLQHAHNPVDWYEWNEDAFAKAKKEDKPIFLSIGYAACHWCHVMAHESFESEEVAAVLNRGFVAIKVDREERPDIDEIYMAYTQQATGSGGWPMSVWLTPEGVPFLARTYIPKDSFISALDQISAAWKTDRERITSGAANAQEFFDAWALGPEPAEGVIPKETIERTATMLAGYFDKNRGGISGGGTNKFPPSMSMDLMLRVHRHNANAELLSAVDVTLDHMRRGGIYDHIGGGICRYSTDREWLVPHFEKMLYDQAMVSSIYLDGFLVTKNTDYAALAADIFDYVLEDLTSPEGGFYSSRDADSDGLEGAFYIWTVEQIQEALGEEEGKLCCAYFDITPKGNWFERLGHAPAGPKNIPRLLKSREAFAKLHQLDVGELPNRIAEWREKLHAVRSKRTPPGLDDKVLTGWNGLMIAAMAKGAFILDEPKYADAAIKAADFVLENMRKDDRLLRTSRRGESRLTAYLSDYAFFIEGLINLYEVTGDSKWLTEAVSLTDVVIRHYFDKKRGGFFFTSDDGEALIARSKNPHDGAIPAGNSILAVDLLRLGGLMNRNDYREKAESIFRAFAPRVEANPAAFERLLCAVDFYYDAVKQIAVIGRPDSADTKAMLNVLRQRYIPNRIIASAADGSSSVLPLLKGKTRRDGKATAYVCENYVCKRPVTSPAELASQLDAK